MACLYPPQPPEEALLALQWDGLPTEFDGNVSYTCKDENLYFEMDKDMIEYNVTCLEDGTFEEPEEWPVCLNSKGALKKTILRIWFINGARGTNGLLVWLVSTIPPLILRKKVQHTIEVHIVGSMYGKGGNLLKYTICKLG